MRVSVFASLIGLCLCFCFWLTGAQADERSFVLATTTSTENSGLLDHLIPKFTSATGVDVRVVAVGTGQALALGRRGDAAALLTHDRLGEDAFVVDGHGTDRRDVMYNDFVLISPHSDPANIASAADVSDALNRIAASGSTFLSRGDDSGTHRRERRLWTEAALDPKSFPGWYRETGAGMGQTLLTATEMDGYTLTDRGTWISFARKENLRILFEGDPPLNNPYSSILVTHSRVPDAEAAAARTWHDWLTSAAGREAINAFRISGQQLFFADVLVSQD